MTGAGKIVTTGIIAILISIITHFIVENMASDAYDQTTYGDWDGPHWRETDWSGPYMDAALKDLQEQGRAVLKKNGDYEKYEALKTTRRITFYGGILLIAWSLYLAFGKGSYIPKDENNLENQKDDETKKEELLDKF